MMGFNNMETIIKKTIIEKFEKEIQKETNYLIEKMVDDFRNKLVEKSHQITSLILNDVMVYVEDSPHDLSRNYNIRFPKIYITK